jgi:hypothetical protein
MYGLEREKNVEKKTREVTENPKKEWTVSVDIFLFGYEKRKKIVARSCDPNKATTTRNNV